MHKYNRKNKFNMKIKTFNEFINESFGDGCGLDMHAVNRAGEKFRNDAMFKSVLDAKAFMINWLKTNGGEITYFHIHAGSNFSEPDGLVAWGGEGGYFYNVVNSSYKDHQQFTYREISKIERSEVDINSYLGIK